MRLLILPIIIQSSEKDRGVNTLRMNHGYKKDCAGVKATALEIICTPA